MANVDQENFTCISDPKITITYSGTSENNFILPVLKDAGELQQQPLNNTSLNTPGSTVQPQGRQLTHASS